MTRSIAQAARDAVSGEDETLWQACYERVNTSGYPEQDFWALAKLTQLMVVEGAIQKMSPAELKLYDISSDSDQELT